RAAAERDRLAGDREGRDHQPVAVEIVEAAALARLDEPGLRREREVDVVAPQLVDEPVPALRRVAERERLDRLAADPPPFAVRARLRAGARVEQHAMEPRACDVVRVIDRLPLVARARRARIFRLELDAGALREDAHGVDEPDVLVLLQEAERVAARAAAEALEEAAVGVDVKRRRLLAVERAQPDEIVAALAQRDVRPDHLADVGAGQDLALDAVVDTHGTHVRRAGCPPRRASPHGGRRERRTPLPEGPPRVMVQTRWTCRDRSGSTIRSTASSSWRRARWSCSPRRWCSGCG